MSRKLLAEVAGTFALVFVGTGAVVLNDATGGAVTHVGVSLAFGLIVTAMIYALGDVSGAHINPAVTLGFLIARRISWRVAGPYIVAQFVGAVLASLLLKAISPWHPTLGATLPAGSAVQSLGLEVLLTLILMYVVLTFSTGAKEKGVWTGVAVGAVVALEAYFGGPISGASMNPARSLGPALVSLNVAPLWIYFVAPAVGAAGAVPLCRMLHRTGCCAATCEAPKHEPA